MKVVLLADVKGTGKKDQLVEVSDGFGRNYLIPKKLAMEATASAVNDINNKQKAKEHQLEVELAEAKRVAGILDGRTVEIKAKAGANGKLFGSVTAKEIAAALQKDTGCEVSKNKIVLEGEIKSFGTFEAKVKVYTGVQANVKVRVAE